MRCTAKITGILSIDINPLSFKTKIYISRLNKMAAIAMELKTMEKLQERIPLAKEVIRRWYP